MHKIVSLRPQPPSFFRPQQPLQLQEFVVVMLNGAVPIELSVRGSIERSVYHRRVGGTSHDPQRTHSVQLVGILYTMDAQYEQL